MISSSSLLIYLCEIYVNPILVEQMQFVLLIMITQERKDQFVLSHRIWECFY